MDLIEMPAGFGPALARNEQAVNAYAMMTKEQKNAILVRARQARSAKEMEHLISSIAAESIM